jgi:hypothetical protein
MKGVSEIVTLLFAVLILMSCLPFSSVSVKAQSQKIVYVVQMVDCEMWGSHNQYLGSSNPHPTIDLREYASSPPSTVSRVMDSNLRNGLKDNFGNSFKVTWFAEMDYLMSQSVFVYADGSSAGVSGYTAIYDILKANWGLQIVAYGDSLEYHHHFMTYDGTWKRHDSGPDAGYGDYQNYALDHMIIDRNFYPSCFDAGWAIMPDALSNWLDNYLPFDYTYLGSTGIWYPVHPSGHTRWATQTDNFASQSGVNAAFATAESRGSALYSFTMHDREDMYGNITATHNWLVAAQSAYPDVLFEYVTARQAMQLALGWSDFASPTFTVSYNTALKTYYVCSNEPLWANHPYVALKYTDGTYTHMQATQTGTNTWSITPTGGTLQSIGFAASDLSGNPGVWVDTPMTAAISPTSVEMDVEQSRQFSSSVLGGNAPYSYQWYLNGSPVPGATGSAWTFTPSTGGQYSVYVSVTDNQNMLVSSNTATINIHAQLNATISPPSVNMTVNATQQFTSIVTGGLTPYTYRWYYSNGTTIPGATASTLAYKANLTGTYKIYLNVTDKLNFLTQSNLATINVNSQPTTTISPAFVDMTIGDSQQFSSSVTGGLMPYVYQWRVNESIVSEATASTWTFNPTSVGIYTVSVITTDSYNITAQSNSASVTVEIPFGTPSPTLTPSSYPSPSTPSTPNLPSSFNSPPNPSQITIADPTSTPKLVILPTRSPTQTALPTQPPNPTTSPSSSSHLNVQAQQVTDALVIAMAIVTMLLAAMLVFRYRF